LLTLKNIGGIAHPPYLFRPTQIATRVWRELAWRSSTRGTVRLPWGLDIVVNPREAIGRNICTRGLYDLAVTEALWRLVGPGELTLDVGANIGYTAGLLAIRAGRGGHVICFEPHPEIFSRLRENVALWRTKSGCAAITLQQVALGDSVGTARLQAGGEFDRNSGTARLVTSCDKACHDSIEVKLETLDAALAEGQHVGVMKLDAEGSEIAILRGMERILSQKRVRDIVFEEVTGFPSQTHLLLQDAGYTVMGLQATMLGVRCLAEAAPRNPAGGDPPSYLASAQPDRALKLLQPAGWQSFGILSGIRKALS
jgi:FkbM family methyltransferase